MPVWEVEYTDEFDGWFQTLTEEDKANILGLNLARLTGIEPNKRVPKG